MNVYFWALAAAIVGSFSGAIPGLHVLNVIGLLALLLTPPTDAPTAVAVTGALLGSYALSSSIPATLLSAPDESAFFSVLPAQQLVRQGRAGQVLALSALGTLAGLLVVLLLLLPPVQFVVDGIHAILRRHQYWVLWAIIIYLMQSEWPRRRVPGLPPLAALARAWCQIGAGLLVFLSCGLLGCLTFYGSILPPDHASQGLMPVFVGLFATPWLLSNILAPTPRLPPQDLRMVLHAPPSEALRATAAGALGGSLAAILPGVTGGVGGWMSGQLLGTHRPHTWLIAQATTRTIYYLGSCALLFVPGVYLARGGAAWLLSGIVDTGSAQKDSTLLLYLLSCAIGVFAARLLLPHIGRGTTSLVAMHGTRQISAACLLLLVAFVSIMTGLPGLLLLLTATGLGLMPQILGCKRMHLLGIILLPIALSISDLGSSIETFLGIP